MATRMKLSLLATVLLLLPTVAFAGDPENSTGTTSMKEDKDGNLEPGEFEKISPNGSVTRALCPYTCEQRGLEAKNCKTWKSELDTTRCYVQDTRLPSNAVPMGGEREQES